MPIRRLKKRQWRAALLAAALFGFSLVMGRSAAPQPPKEIEIQGKTVCLPELMHRLYGVELPAEHRHVYGFQAQDGEIYTLLRTKFSEALFEDDRVRVKQLLLKGRVFPHSHLFEVTRTRSVRNGTVYDLHYFCSVCNIESVSPGPCACCQGPVELVETP